MTALPRQFRRAATVAAIALGAASLPFTAAHADYPNAPVIRGEATVGATLSVTVDPTTFKGCGSGAGPDYRINWTRDGAPVPTGADPTKYTLTTADRGTSLTVVVSSNPPCAAMTISSAPTSPVADANRNVGFTSRGTAELLARTASGDLMLYPRSAAGWETPRTIGPGWNTFDLVFSPGDFTGDGAIDVMGRTPDGTLWLYPGDGHGGLGAGKAIGWGWNAFDQIVAAGDFTGDGTNDLLARDRNGGLFLYPGNGHGGWGTPSQVGWGWGGFDAITVTGDFDGRPGRDVLARDRNGDLFLYAGDGHGGWRGTGTQVGEGWDVMSRIGGAGDFTADSVPDLWAIDNAGTLWAYEPDGSGGWAGSQEIGWGWGGFTIVS